MGLPPVATTVISGHLVSICFDSSALVLVAHVAGKAHATTALGSELFVIGRVAHCLVYTLGIPYLRTAVFAVASIGELMILLQLFN